MFFISINISYVIQWYRLKQFSSMNIVYLIISVIFIYISTISNTFVYENQDKHQKKLGDRSFILAAVNTVRNKSECVKIYTNYHYLLYSLYAKPIQDKVVDGEVNLDFLTKSVEHDCMEGRYIVFRTTTRSYPIWKYIKKLEDSKFIIKHNKSRYIYYIPPYTILKDDYFEQ
jgi:hypothetical protein